MTTANTHSVLLPGTTVEGELYSDSDIVIGGRIRGNVIGKAVEVQAGGSIQGNVQANKIIIDGTVKGIVRTGTAFIGSDATLEGRLEYNKVDIAEGARIDVQFVAVFTPKTTDTHPSTLSFPTKVKSGTVAVK